MDVFELATKLTATGAEQVHAALEGVSVHGMEASGVLDTMSTSMATVTAAAAVVAAALATVSAIAVKMAAEVDQSVRLAAGTIPGAADQMEEFSNAIKNAALSGHGSQAELAKLFATIGQSGVENGSAAIERFEAVLKATRATGADTTSTVYALSQVLRLFSLGSDKSSHVMSTLFAVAQQSRVGFDQLLLSFQRLAPVIQGVGVDFDTAARAVGTLLQEGRSPRQLLQALNGLDKEGFQALADHTKITADQMGALDRAEKLTAESVSILAGKVKNELMADLIDLGKVLLPLVTAELKGLTEILGDVDTHKLVGSQAVTQLQVAGMQWAAITKQLQSTNINVRGNAEAQLMNISVAANNAVVAFKQGALDLDKLDKTQLKNLDAGITNIAAKFPAFAVTAKDLLDKIHALENAPPPPKLPPPPGPPPETTDEYASRLKGYTDAFAAYLKVLDAGVGIESTRRQSLEQLTQFETLYKARLADTTLTLEERIRVSQLLAATEKAIAEGDKALKAQQTAASEKALGGQVTAQLDVTLGDFMKNVAPELQKQMAAAKPAISAAALDLVATTQAAVDSAFQQAPGQLSASIGDALSAGFTGGIGAAKDVLLSSLGGIFTRMGKALVAFGLGMKSLAAALTNPFTAGPAAVAFGVMLIGLGAALGSIAGGGGVGGGGTGSTAVPNFGTPGTPGNEIHVIIDGQSVSQVTPTRAGSANAAGPTYTGAVGSAAASTVPPKQSIHFTVIGPADPQAQTAIGKLIDNVVRRGYRLPKTAVGA